jgi:4-amino-4-deoxychorismate lyase
MIFVNGVKGGAIDPMDRGLSYGDGVFRTFPLCAGRVPHWHRHYTKLANDSARLQLACPQRSLLENDLQEIARAFTEGVVRITLTRGTGVRGYAIPEKTLVTRIVSFTPQGSSIVGADGVRARWCRLRLATQPALAGVKHLNRLENVLARSEWSDTAIAEGLLLDVNGHVIAGTMTNLFILHRGDLITPQLDACGVAGVTRDLVIERATQARMNITVTTITPETLLDADAVFLVNSVIGMWQITTLEEKTWSVHPLGAQIRSWITDDHQ